MVTDRRDKGRGAAKINRQTWKLPGNLAAAVKDSLDDWKKNDKVQRLWLHNASLWTGKDEGEWMGWLSVTNNQLAHLDRLTRISEAARKSGFTHVLLLGMGGSSLCPEVLKRTFGKMTGYPEFHVLDPTDPA
jgi:hypothetical protein